MSGSFLCLQITAPPPSDLLQICSVLIFPMKSTLTTAFITATPSSSAFLISYPCYLFSEKAKATHSSALAWRIPGTAEPGGLPSMGSHSRTQLKRLSSSSSSYLFCYLSVSICVYMCIYIIHFVAVIQQVSHVRLFATLWTIARQAPLSMGSPGKNTGVSCHALLQGIFLTQGSNPSLLLARQILYH